MNIGERMKKVRTDKGLTQQEMADAIGLKRNTIATYEIGRGEPSPRTISDICRKFGVNEKWLSYENGEPYITLNRAEEVARLARDVVSDESGLRARLVAVISRLDEAQLETVAAVARALVEEMEKPS